MFIGLLGVVVITRFLGKKQLSQVTTLDFVYILVLGGIVQQAIYEPHIRTHHMLFAFLVWGGFIWIVETCAQRFDKFRTIIKGPNSILVQNGKVNVKALEKSKLEMGQLRTLLREQGVFSVKDVKHAVLETSGMLSVMTYASKEPVTKEDILEDYPENDPTYLLVEEKDINYRNLKHIGKTKVWLLKELEKEGHKLENLYFAEWNKLNGFYFQTYDEKESEGAFYTK
jgi:uncharacterized membrane protein YcaP (DUF421 family)